MAGELNIKDDGYERELLGLSAPLAFIDFEAFMPQNYIIPGTRTTDTIPCQWSCHILSSHGLNWRGGLSHSEFLWTGDRGWSPIYAFTESLYEATIGARTLLIYTDYEVRCLNMCKQLAQNDMDAYHNAIRNENNEPEQAEYWKNYVVVDARGRKVPLMDIAPKIANWCDSMLSRFYDMCYGYGRNGGVLYWLQSPELQNSNSIKHVMPVAMKEYSGTAELMRSEGEPENGYEGLRQQGCIAKGDECTSRYLSALNRPPRSGVSPHQDGNAPFDSSVESQCLRYCRLDTLSMVLIYLAVLEGTQRWREVANGKFGDYAKFSDGLYHAVIFDADTKTYYKACDHSHNEPHDYSESLDLVSKHTLDRMNIRDFYGSVCPHCRRLNNES